MPRANRRRTDHAALDLERVRGGSVQTVRYAGQVWAARHVRGSGEGRVFRCPGCAQDLPDTEPHVVAWPQDGLTGLENRRHWHATCWQARERRRPPGSYA